MTPMHCWEYVGISKQFHGHNRCSWYRRWAPQIAGGRCTSASDLQPIDVGMRACGAKVNIASVWEMSHFGDLFRITFKHLLEMVSPMCGKCEQVSI